MYIVGFNGPPESGKDTLAEMLAEHMNKQGVTLPVRFESLSLPLRKIAYAMVDWPGELDGPAYADFKRTEFPRLGTDGRHIMIDASERFLKVVYGIDVMAQLLLERNEGFHGVLLIRDCGFQCEVSPLEQAVGAANLYMNRVTRAGKTFADLNDSREFVQATNMNYVSNDGTLDDLRVEAGRIYGRLVNQLGWKL